MSHAGPCRVVVSVVNFLTLSILLLLKLSVDGDEPLGVEMTYMLMGLFFSVRSRAVAGVTGSWSCCGVARRNENK